MRVAFDGRVIADHYPGIGRYAFGLARALAEMADLTLIVNPAAPNARFDLEALPARRLPVRAGPASLAAQWLVPRVLARRGFDVYHSPYFVMPYALGGVSSVKFATFFDLTPLLPEAGYGPGPRLAVRLGHRLAARAASRVIALSRWARDSFAAEMRLPPEMFEIIPPGVDEAFKPRPRKEIEAVRARLRLPGEYLLYVGTQRPHKNLARLIQAHAHLPQDAPPLVLAGPGGRSVADQPTGRLRFLGPVAEADLPALYSGAALFVLPSLAEGFGLPVLEAMACGAPVACSTRPGLDEAAGSAAARFDPLSVESMTHVLAALLHDEESRLARREAGLKHALGFSWERAARATLDVYAHAIQA